MVAALLLAAPATASFSGRAGPIAYADFHGIHLLDPLSGASRLIARHGHGPVLFPGSRRFAYVREVGWAPAPGRAGGRYSQRELFVKGIGAGVAAPGRPLFGPRAFSLGGLSVSPDGSRIVFAGRRGFGPSRDDGHDEEIWSAAAAGDEVRRLTDDRFRDLDPEVSPDGGRIAFSRRIRGRAQIFVMNVDGSDQRRLTFDRHRDRTPSWSPDGRRVLYFEQKISGDGAGHSRELFTIPAGGGRPTQLTHDEIDESYPVYSPDGRHIAFERELSLWEMPATGGRPHRLNEVEPAEVGPPDWGTVR
jgi:dipeptidyl aminopeptidase/acylaminoacyl peptidase